MSGTRFRAVVITAAVLLVLADAATAFAIWITNPPAAAGVATSPARGFAGRRPYRFGPGRAAAIGYLTGAAAVAVATSPAPDDDSCWFYTDPSQSAGYWDDCPQ